MQRERWSCVSLVANLIVSVPRALPVLLQASIRLDICSRPAAARPLLVWPVVQDVRPGGCGRVRCHRHRPRGLSFALSFSTRKVIRGDEATSGSFCKTTLKALIGAEIWISTLLGFLKGSQRCHSVSYRDNRGKCVHASSLPVPSSVRIIPRSPPISREFLITVGIR